MANYSIKKTENRERRYAHLKEATGEGHTSQALDVAARYYIKMRGDNSGVHSGKVGELLDAAEDRDGLSAEEIADILDTDELPVAYDVEITRTRNIGRE